MKTKNPAQARTFNYLKDKYMDIFGIIVFVLLFVSFLFAALIAQSPYGIFIFLPVLLVVFVPVYFILKHLSSIPRIQSESLTKLMEKYENKINEHQSNLDEAIKTKEKIRMEFISIKLP